jgi:hypothetical protein
VHRIAARTQLSAQSQEREDCEDHYDNADQPKNVVHQPGTPNAGAGSSYDGRVRNKSYTVGSRRPDVGREPRYAGQHGFGAPIRRAAEIPFDQASRVHQTMTRKSDFRVARAFLYRGEPPRIISSIAPSLPHRTAHHGPSSVTAASSARSRCRSGVRRALDCVLDVGPASHGASVGTTLMLLNGEPLMSFVLTTV